MDQSYPVSAGQLEPKYGLKEADSRIISWLPFPEMVSTGVELDKEYSVLYPTVVFCLWKGTFISEGDLTNTFLSLWNSTLPSMIFLIPRNRTSGGWDWGREKSHSTSFAVLTICWIQSTVLVQWQSTYFTCRRSPVQFPTSPVIRIR